MKPNKPAEIIEWCIKKASQEGKKHKGLKKFEPDKEKVNEHLRKATRNLRVAEHLLEGGYSDWSVSALFYAMYHCLLAVLWNYGYESRNQTCTFAVIKYLIDKGKVDITLDELQNIQESGEEDKTVVDVREYYQYGTDTEVEKDKLENLKQQAKAFVTKIRTVLEE